MISIILLGTFLMNSKIFAHEFLHGQQSRSPVFLAEDFYQPKTSGVTKKNEDQLIFDDLTSKLSTDKNENNPPGTYFYEEIKNIKYTKPEDQNTGVESKKLRREEEENGNLLSRLLRIRRDEDASSDSTTKSAIETTLINTEITTPPSFGYIIDVDVIDIISKNDHNYNDAPFETITSDDYQNFEDDWRSLEKRSVVDASNINPDDVPKTHLDDDVLRLTPAASSIVFRPLFAYRNSRN